MKTKSLFKWALTYATYSFVFFWTAFSVNAQCPTINDPTPTICDAAGYTFADLSADYATDTGNGIVWYDADSGGSSFNPSELVYEGTYYIDNDSGNCTTPRESITIDFQVNSPSAGVSLDKFYCSNENATIQNYIDDALATYIPTGVEIYYDFDLTIQANTSDILSIGVTTCYIVFTNGACKSQINVGNTIVSSSPADPTPPVSQTFCSDPTPTIADLDPGTTSSYSWYGNINGAGDPIPPALSPTTPLVDGATYYVQVDEIICDSNAIPVIVTISNPNDPGSSGSLEYCQDSVPTSDFDLFDELGGTPDITGIWSGPLSTSNGYQGTVNISTLTTAGVYTFTYTVPANGACPESSANVTITIYETLTSGTVSAQNPATFCESGLPLAFDLFTLIENYDVGGQWTQGTLSTDPIVTSPIDLTAFAPGTYNFTYTQNLSPNPCPEESTTVQVIVLQDPNAGTANNQEFCENDLASNSPFDLFDALTAPYDSGGTWTDASNATVSDPLNIDITGFTVTGSPYNFTYTVDNGTCTDDETISITILPAPQSGTANAPVEFCEGTAPASFDLFDLLEGEDQTGSWYIGTDNLGATISNPVDLSAYTANTYNFTYDVDAIGSCDDVLVTVSVIINPLPNTGTPNNPPPYCENDPALNNTAFDLFTLLNAPVDAGGTWSDDSTTPVSGALSGNTLDLSQLVVNTYNFTYSITDANGCSNSTTVAIVIDDAPESGTVNTPVEFCASDITTGQTYDLFDLLTGEDQTGVWNDDDATGAVSGNMVTLDGLAQGTYNFTYDVNAIGSCDDVNVTVSIVINDTPAPTASTPQEFCDTATVANLVATGTTIQWYDVSTGGTPLADTTALVDGQTYYATQTDATTGCESSARTAVLATIYSSPNAGDPNTAVITACNDNNSIDLFTGLDGTQDAGGTWNNDDGIGTLSGNIFDATGVSAGTYSFTYTVTASAPCVDDSETITVTIEAPLDAGTDGAPLDLCSDDVTVDLFTQLGGTPDTGGTWSPDLTSGTGVFDPSVDVSGTYIYTVSNACGTNTSEIDVTVTQAPNAGTDNSITICVINGNIDLFTQLGGTPDTGGTWSPALASGTGEFDPTVDASGVYIYTVASVLPCRTDASAQITVTVNDSPAPVVVDPNPTFCMADNPTVADLDASITATGTIIWYTDATLTTALSSTDVLIDGEDYFATQTNSTGCESSQNVQVDVTINDTATPTLSNPSEDYCINDNPTIMDLTLNITEYDSNTNNIIWYDVATGGSALTSSSMLSNGVTYYAAMYDATTGCESSVRLAVLPDVTACGKLVLPDGFSPNGDGVNDTYDYNNLDILYPNFEIEIFNRYGNVVYKGNASTPRFDGTSNQSSLGDGKLPVGVYYYIFKFNDGQNKPEQGRLYLSR